MPSSSLVEVGIEVEVGVEVGVEFGIEVGVGGVGVQFCIEYTYTWL